MTSAERVAMLAERLAHAFETRTPCAPLTEDARDLGVDEAYAIQARNVAARVAQGARLVGHKIGITSRAVQQWLKVSEPDFGCLLSDMVVLDGMTASTSSLLQPRIEGEIAFVLARDLEGPAVTPADVMRATDFLLPALEIIDSRIAGWQITYRDTVADNASSGLFVVGSTPVSARGLDLELCGMALSKNGAVASTGAGAACLEHPVNAVVWLANKLADVGEKLRAGHVVLSGALGPVAQVSAGDVVELDVAHLGRARVRFA